MAEPGPTGWPQGLGGRRLLVSGFGKWGGGIYDLTSGAPHALDDLPTSGLAVGGGRLWRVLRAPGEQTATCELLSYDRLGVRSYQRLDMIRDPHDVCWHDGAVHVSSSWNTVVWRLEGEGTPGGRPRPVWRGGPIPDSWHLNSLVVVDGRLLVCAFGRFDRHKEWKGEGKRRAGFVRDIAAGIDVLTGLGHPHCPRWVDGSWYVCESTSGSLVEYDGHGREQRRLGIQRFSRGLAIVGPWAFVGGNAHRDDPGDRAEMVVIDRARFEIVERIPMPCLEVYDILPVPFALARGVAIGFGANPARAVEQHRGAGRVPDRRPAPTDTQVRLVPPRVAAKLTEPGHVLDRAVASRCRLSAELPVTLTSGIVRTLPVVVENRSKLAIASVVPHPIRIGARWWPCDAPSGEGADPGRPGEPAGGELRNPLAPLPRLIHPGESAAAEIVLEAPDRPGRYELRVALHQPGLGWFGRRVQGRVTVTPPATPAGLDRGPAAGGCGRDRGQPRGSVTRP